MFSIFFENKFHVSFVTFSKVTNKTWAAKFIKWLPLNDRLHYFKLIIMISYCYSTIAVEFIEFLENRNRWCIFRNLYVQPTKTNINYIITLLHNANFWRFFENPSLKMRKSSAIFFRLIISVDESYIGMSHCVNEYEMRGKEVYQIKYENYI